MTDSSYAPNEGPASDRVPEVIVALIGGKLIGLDSILPVLMEVKSETPGIDIEFLFLSRRTLQEISGNYVLMRGMSKIGRVRTLSSSTGSLLSKLAAAARLLAWAIRLIARRSLVLGYSDFGAFPVSLLARAARLRGATVNYIKTSYLREGSFREELAEKLKRKSLAFSDRDNVCLIYHPEQAADQQHFVAGRFVTIGTPRRFPAWRRHLDDVYATDGLRDIEGNPISIGPGPVFVFFYPGNHSVPALARPTSCRDQFVRFMTALSELSPGAQVLIKPHVICDLNELRDEIAAYGALDIHITEAHPGLLARIATVAVLANASNVTNDMYVDGVPVLELCEYNERIRTGYGTRHPNVGRIGAVSEAEVRDALKTILADPIGLTKPEPGHLSWPKPPSVSARLWPVKAP